MWLIIYSLILVPSLTGGINAYGDFLATYTAVNVIRSGQSDALYNLDVQKQIRKRRRQDSEHANRQLCESFRDQLLLCDHHVS